MDEAILSQAAHWCMRLQENTCTQAEKLAFKEWIQMDPRHAFEYAKMLEIWDISDQLPNHKNTSKKLLTDLSTRQHAEQKIGCAETGAPLQCNPLAKTEFLN
jgi:transmembrane sensor